MITFNEDIKKQLLDLKNDKDVILEGNILKVIDTETDEVFEEYIQTCIKKDKETRRKRLEVTRRVQNQNNELTKLNNEHERILNELQLTLNNVEESRKQIEEQNEELLSWKEANEKIQLELQEEMKKTEKAKLDAERAKSVALNDLDLLQKKKQTELMSNIVKVALGVIAFIAIVTTGLYIFSILINKETDNIGQVWNNLFGILLTNSFSIVGTIMGVKYANKGKNCD